MLASCCLRSILTHFSKERGIGNGGQVIQSAILDKVSVDFLLDRSRLWIHKASISEKGSHGTGFSDEVYSRILGAPGVGELPALLLEPLQPFECPVEYAAKLFWRRQL